MQDAIAAALEAAQQAAGQLPANVVPAANAPTGTALGAPMAAGAPLSIDDMMMGSLQVDAWLKVNEYGLFIGDDKTPFDSIKVSVDLEDIKYCFSVKWGQNPAKYAKTYDHIMDTQGRPWVQTVQHAQAQDAKAYEYRSADVPLIALEDLKNKAGEVLVSAGDVLGFSISATGWKYFSRFIATLQKSGINTRQGVIIGSIGYEARQKDTSKWGNVTFGEFRSEVVN